MKIKLSAVTDRGKERENNEDAFVLCPDLKNPDWSVADTATHLPLGPYGTLAVVADGMGGANAGDVASALAIDFIKKSFVPDVLADVVKSDATVRQFLTDLVRQADDFIQTHAFDHPETAGMGTTLVVCWIVPAPGDAQPSAAPQAYVAWCGDSRCYVFNPAKGLRPLTKDHSYVQQLIDSGQITEAEAFTHPDSNLITRGLGDLDFDAEPDMVCHALQTGDWLLLCSDGLCGYCTNDDIERTLRSHYPDASVSRDHLLQMALDAGGYDNITVAIASAIADDAAEPQQQPASGGGGFIQWLKSLFLGG